MQRMIIRTVFLTLAFVTAMSAMSDRRYVPGMSGGGISSGAHYCKRCGQIIGNGNSHVCTTPSTSSSGSSSSYSPSSGGASSADVRAVLSDPNLKFNQTSYTPLDFNAMAAESQAQEQNTYSDDGTAQNGEFGPWGESLSESHSSDNDDDMATDLSDVEDTSSEIKSNDTGHGFVLLLITLGLAFGGYRLFHRVKFRDAIRRIKPSVDSLRQLVLTLATAGLQRVQRLKLRDIARRIRPAVKLVLTLVTGGLQRVQRLKLRDIARRIRPAVKPAANRRMTNTPPSTHTDLQLIDVTQDDADEYAFEQHRRTTAYKQVKTDDGWTLSFCNPPACSKQNTKST